jgi:BlaI family transcriptional regulator, penicillinase repressor
MKKRKSLPPISEAESVVMQALWTSSPAGADDVFARVGTLHDWQEATVKTLLGRLLLKGAVGVNKEGRRYLYSATFTRDEWLAAESTGFLDRRFGGRVAPLVAHFSAQRRLTKSDLAELKRLISELDDDR